MESRWEEAAASGAVSETEVTGVDVGCAWSVGETGVKGDRKLMARSGGDLQPLTETGTPLGSLWKIQ